MNGNGYGSRKFILVLGANVLVFILVLINKITGNDFVSFVEIFDGVYLGLNVVQKGVTSLKNNINNKNGVKQ